MNLTFPQNAPFRVARDSFRVPHRVRVPRTFAAHVKRRLQQSSAAPFNLDMNSICKSSLKDTAAFLIDSDITGEFAYYYDQEKDTKVLFPEGISEILTILAQEFESLPLHIQDRLHSVIDSTCLN